jgi:hypothetical protein
MDKVNELKNELAQLEGRPLEPAPVAPDNTARVKGVFDHLLFESSEERQREVEAANLARKTCCECFRVQTVIAAVCELCGAVPVLWLPAAEFPENRELDGLRELAAEASIERLEIALRSGWCSARPERERVARNLLAARLRQHDAEQSYKERKELEPVPQRSMADQVRAATKFCDIQIARIDEQIAALKTETGG